MNALKFRLVVLSALLCFFNGAAYAQSAYHIEGRIVDQSTGSIGNAKLILITPDQLRDFAADEDGHFALADLPPGTYDLEVHSLGFKIFHTQVTLADRSVDDMMVVLAPGSCPQCVTVTECRDAPSAGLPVNPKSPPQGGPGHSSSYSYGYYSSYSYASRPDSANLRGTIRDGFGRPLAGVAVSVSGAGKPSRFISDEQGEFEAVDFAPGQYVLVVTQSAFDSSRSGIPPSATVFWVTRQGLTSLTVAAHIFGLCQ